MTTRQAADTGVRGQILGPRFAADVMADERRIRGRYPRKETEQVADLRGERQQPVLGGEIERRRAELVDREEPFAGVGVPEDEREAAAYAVEHARAPTLVPAGERRRGICSADRVLQPRSTLDLPLEHAADRAGRRGEGGGGPTHLERPVGREDLRRPDRGGEPVASAGRESSVEPGEHVGHGRMRLRAGSRHRPSTTGRGTTPQPA